jgi:hypothetical protein
MSIEIDPPVSFGFLNVYAPVRLCCAGSDREPDPVVVRHRVVAELHGNTPIAILSSEGCGGDAVKRGARRPAHFAGVQTMLERFGIESEAVSRERAARAIVG